MRTFTIPLTLFFSFATLILTAQSDDSLYTTLVSKYLTLLKKNDALSFYSAVDSSKANVFSVQSISNTIELQQRLYGQVQSCKFKGKKHDYITEDKTVIELELINCYSQVEGSYHFELTTEKNESNFRIVDFYFLTDTIEPFPYVDSISLSSRKWFLEAKFDSLYQSSSPNLKDFTTIEVFERFVFSLRKELDTLRGLKHHRHNFIPSNNGMSILAYYSGYTKKGSPILLKFRYRFVEETWRIEYIGFIL